MKIAGLPSIPDHVEVTLRIGASLLLANGLTLASLPAAIPPSQTVVIASVTAAWFWPKGDDGRNFLPNQSQRVSVQS